jgi:hypothetical protein
MSELFDFEAFIAGSKLAEDTFTLYLVNHGPAIARLQAQIEQAKSSGDDRESTVSPDVSHLEQQIARLTAEMHKSKREVTLRQLNYDEIDMVTSPDTDVYDQLAAQAVNPPLDREQWKRLAVAVGATHFGQFVGKANALATSGVVVPDFSPNASTTPDQRESSPS